MPVFINSNGTIILNDEGLFLLHTIGNTVTRTYT